MAIVPTITVDTVIESLAAFLQPFVDGPVIRSQVNRVPMPITGFVELRDLFQRNLSTPIQLQNDLQATITTFAQIDIQIDLYGPAAGEWARSIEAVFRSPYAVDQFPIGVAPLYTSDAHQSPLVTGEEQYEYRYIITASLEYNPDVIVPQQSATSLQMNILEDLP